MSVSVYKIKHEDTEYPEKAGSYADFFERLLDIFHVEYNANTLYLPDEATAREMVKNEPKEFIEAVVEFGKANGWESDYWVGW